MNQVDVKSVEQMETSLLLVSIAALQTRITTLNHAKIVNGSPAIRTCYDSYYTRISMSHNITQTCIYISVVKMYPVQMAKSPLAAVLLRPET